MTTALDRPEMQVGSQVIVKDPNDFLAEVRNKVKDGRVGEIVRLRDDDSVMVSFPKVGRRKEYRHAFRAIFLSPADPVVEQDPVAPSRSKPGM